MTYKLLPQELASVTDAELAFSTTRFLPAIEDIPAEFWAGNIYTKLAKSLFCGSMTPACEIELNEGVDAAALNKCIRAHLQSWAPKHEHKIAGVGYMLASVCTLTPLPA